MSDLPNAKRPSEDTSASESLPVLVGRLGEDLTELVDSKLSLLKLELQEDIRGYARSGAWTFGGGLAAAIGLGLLGAAVAFVVSSLLTRAAGLSLPVAYALGFAGAGLLFLVGGGVVAVRAARQLRAVESASAATVEALAQHRQPHRPGRA